MALNITTKISRDEMVIAQLADPRFKKCHWTQQKKGRVMVDSIIRRMDRLVLALVSRAFTRYAHYTDRANSIDDMIATVKGELVLAIYRYQHGGKYEPYNYLMGVATVVLKNIHVHRNRKKRIPGHHLVSIDAYSSGNGDNDDGSNTKSRLIDNLHERTSCTSLELYLTSDPMDSLVSRIDVESIFNALKGRVENVTFRDCKKKKHTVMIDYYKILSLILDGNSIASVAKIYHIPRNVMGSIIKNKIIKIIDVKC